MLVHHSDRGPSPETAPGEARGKGTPAAGWATDRERAVTGVDAQALEQTRCGAVETEDFDGAKVGVDEPDVSDPRARADRERLGSVDFFGKAKYFKILATTSVFSSD